MALNGQETDRLVFWPKIFNDGYIRNQKPPFNSMTIREIYDFTDTDMHIYLPDYIDMHFKRYGYSEQKENDLFIKTFNTPRGQIKSILRYDEITDSYHPEALPIKTKDDILAMTAYFADLSPGINIERLEKSKTVAKEFGERGLAVDTIGESPLMDFLEWYAGIENGQYLLADYPEETEELFSVMHHYLLECTKLKCRYSPADVLYFTENTSTTLISPAQFIKYCKKHLSAYAEICAEYGRKLSFPPACAPQTLKEVTNYLYSLPMKY